MGSIWEEKMRAFGAKKWGQKMGPKNGAKNGAKKWGQNKGQHSMRAVFSFKGAEPPYFCP